MKFTVSNVNTPFTVVLSSTKVDGDGICPIPSDTHNANDNVPTDFDCRFANFFGSTLPSYSVYPYLMPSSTTLVNVPFCLHYADNNTKCVFYSIQNPPPTSNYSGTIYEYIAWTNTPTAPTQYGGVPQMYDDPSVDNQQDGYPTGTPGFPYPDTNNDDQFIFNITTYFNPVGQVGDGGTGGGTKTFNEFAVAFPLLPSTIYTYSWVSPFSKTPSFKTGTTITVKFTLSPNTPAGIAVQPPNHVGIAVVTASAHSKCIDISGTRQPLVFPGGSPTSFQYDSTKQQYHVNLTEIYPVGTYDVLVNSNLFGQQCATFNVTK
jgi:hypothetical protein